MSAKRNGEARSKPVSDIARLRSEQRSTRNALHLEASDNVIDTEGPADVPSYVRKLPRRFQVGDRIQAILEDRSIIVGVVRKVYVKKDTETGTYLGKYKVDWEGDADLDVSDAESDNLDVYEPMNKGMFFQLFRCLM